MICNGLCNRCILSPIRPIRIKRPEGGQRVVNCFEEISI
jgi:hypothetical protein